MGESDEVKKTKMGESDEVKKTKMGESDEVKKNQKDDSDDSDEDDEGKVIADPVHKFIKVHPLCQKVIDTFEFQRLRDITQSGVSHLVYPAANHSRFEHSLGVYHLAGRFIDEFNRKLKNLNIKVNKKVSKKFKKKIDIKLMITKKEALCVRMAALCHDLGHGPFSHSWENFVFLATGKKWEHEDNSVKILKYLIKENKLENDFAEFGLGDNEVDLIGGLIKGDPPKDYPKERKFLFEIVNNKRNKFDVDKLDYMMRDAFYFNIPCIVDYKRILKWVVFKDNSIQFDPPATGDMDRQDILRIDTSIQFRDKVAVSILEVFDFRKTMHKRCYQHRVTKTIDTMLMEVLLAANEHYFKCFHPEAKEGLTLATATLGDHPSVFVHLTNYIYFEIMHSKHPDLEKSRQIIDRMLKRKLFTLIGTLERGKALKKEDINELEERLNREFENRNYDFKTSIIEASIGTTKDPLLNIDFVTKEGQKQTMSGKGERLESYQIFMVFCTESLDKGNPDLIKMREICEKYLKQFRPIPA